MYVKIGWASFKENPRPPWFLDWWFLDFYAWFFDWIWRNVHYIFSSLKLFLLNYRCLSFSSRAFRFANPPQTEEKSLFSWTRDSSNETVPTLSHMDLTNEVTWRSWRINDLIQSSASSSDPDFKTWSQRPNWYASSASIGLQVKSNSRARFRPTKLTWKIIRCSLKLICTAVTLYPEFRKRRPQKWCC